VSIQYWTSTWNTTCNSKNNIVPDKHKYKDDEKLSVPGTGKCLRTRKNILLKMENLLLIWISDHQAKGDNVNSTLIRQKAKGFLAVLRQVFTSLYLPKKLVYCSTLCLPFNELSLYCSIFVVPLSVTVLRNQIMMDIEGLLYVN
jgi:hypothetical protein